MSVDIAIGAAQHGRDLFDWITAGAAVLGLGVVAAYTVVTYKQWQEAKQANEMAKRNALAALELTERSLIYSKRAWLVATDSQPPHLSWDGDFSKYTLRVSVINTGGVPALVRRESLQMVFTERGVTPITPPSDEEGAPVVERGAEVVPNDAKPVPLGEFRLPQIMKYRFDELREATLDVFIFYTAEYIDCFEKPWRTVACWRCDGESLEWAPAPRYTELR